MPATRTVRKFFPILLILPVLALILHHGVFNWQTISVYLAVISLATYLAYWHDKRRAESEGWRVPEKLLHLLELIGGWPAAFLAQQQFRHKTVKRRYQIIYWSIVALYQYLSLDLLLNWRILHAVTGLF
jgi:uncharacterized membrane protein YsdA (DUF1294 family)